MSLSVISSVFAMGGQSSRWICTKFGGCVQGDPSKILPDETLRGSEHASDSEHASLSTMPQTAGIPAGPNGQREIIMYATE